MKRYFLLASLLLTGMIAFAQTPAPAPTPSKTDSLDAYLGKYVFPSGSQLSEMTVKMDNGILMAVSDQGSSELRKVEGDLFAVVAYEGICSFKRNEEGKVTGCHLEVGDIVLDGTRSETINFYLKPSR